jgi:hypothetical protein
MKKIALIAALLVSTITVAVAAPQHDETSYIERSTDVGENGGGGN